MKAVKRLIDIDEVIFRLSCSKSHWWAGVKESKYPKPVKMGNRSKWVDSEIDALVERIIAGEFQ